MAEEEAKDKEFLEYIIKSIVDNPEDVEIDREVDEMGVLLSLRVHADDMGQVIGRNGSTARAIRTLVRIVGLKSHARVNLKIEEPEGGEQAGNQDSSDSSDEEEDEDLEDLDL
ncbi:MAG: KH domain-containing protein [Candidatus Paceibacterota bacterium]